MTGLRSHNSKQIAVLHRFGTRLSNTGIFMKLKEIILLLAIIAGLAFWYYPREGRPPSNTPAHKSAHGVVEGEWNEIRIGSTLLRIPPHVTINPITENGPIKRGQADSITLGIDYPAYEILESLNQIGIVLRMGYEPKDSPLPTDPTATVTQSSEWGLVEYRSARDDGAWGYVIYWPVDEQMVTPTGNRIRYSCRGLPGQQPTICVNTFIIHGDLQVSYHVTRQLLPHWREIHRDVLQLVDSLIVR